MAFIALILAFIAFMAFTLGIAGIVIGIVLRRMNAKKAKNGIEKSRALSIASVLLFAFGAFLMLPLSFMMGYNVVSGVLREGQERKSLEYNVYADNMDLAAALLESGADPNERTRYIYPPLYFAIENDNYDMAKLLLEYGADPDGRGAWDTQMFHEAVKNNDLRYIKLFVENGADINYAVSGQTPLDVAYAMIGEAPAPGGDDGGIVGYLIESGAMTYAQMME